MFSDSKETFRKALQTIKHYFLKVSSKSENFLFYRIFFSKFPLVTKKSDLLSNLKILYFSKNESDLVLYVETSTLFYKNVLFNVKIVLILEFDGQVDRR